MKIVRQNFVVMNMMNKCAKFHRDSAKDKKVKFNLTSVIELPERADFVYNFVSLVSIQASNFGSAFDQLFLWICLWHFQSRCISTSCILWCKKSQIWPKPQIKGGPALTYKNWRFFPTARITRVVTAREVRVVVVRPITVSASHWLTLGAVESPVIITTLTLILINV